MPIFGKTLFETVLDGMTDHDGDEDGDIDEGARARGPRIVAHFVADTSYSERAEKRPLSDLYDDFGPPPVLGSSTPEKPVPPAWLECLSEPDVAGDLGLTVGMSRPEILGRRRTFAQSNHPDRVAEEFRAAANIRMTIANRLVEKALRDA